MATAFNFRAFDFKPDDPLAAEHGIVSAWVEEAVEALGQGRYYIDVELKLLPSGQTILAAKPEEARRYVAAAAAQAQHWDILAEQVRAQGTTEMQRFNPHFLPGWDQVWSRRRQAVAVMSTLMRRKLPFSNDDLLSILQWCNQIDQIGSHNAPISRIVRALEQFAGETRLQGELLVAAKKFASKLRSAYDKDARRLGAAVEQLYEKSDPAGAAFCLVPGEAWSQAANDEFAHCDVTARRKWSALFAHALNASAARPTAKWVKRATQLIDELGGEIVAAALMRWLPLATQRQMHGAVEANDTCLRGLLWLVPILPQSDELVRMVTAIALSAYKKSPGVGLRSVKVGNAAVYVLSQLGTTDAVGQLAMLQARIKFGTAQKEIDKAFHTAAEALALPRDQIEEIAVPSYGLDEVGRSCESFGDFRAELTVTGSDAALKWFDTKGKPLKSVPAKVKSEHKEDLKELQQSVKDIQQMLPAQRDRIDRMYLLEKSWPLDIWLERYANHPLVGTIARRLIWCVDGTPTMVQDGVLVDVFGTAISHGKTAEMTLWHPVGRSIEEITAWRRRLEDQGITLPFKQAHREVYLLTDAERNTAIYSNRFAAHIIRQHQFNALLLAARGWKNKLRLMVDDVYPPARKDVPNWGLRAEFWIEGIGQDCGVDANNTGTYLRLATDQVRFYRTAAAGHFAHAGGGGYTTRAPGPGDGNVNEPLPLTEIPPLVFSEIMRDVDLFVGVASVGNDPTWQDGGPQGRYRAYWQDYAFGELSGSAATRKEVREQLVPRLAIAERCSFSDRFLVVRGDKRTYKIHLGSGNILMEPIDQYLCIVPDSRARAEQDSVSLPFEGDNMLSIIISKALLLSKDTKIKDETITRQIDSR